MDYLEIYQSKSKAVLLFLTSSTFVIIGIYSIINAEILSSYPDYEQGIMGIITTIIFSLGIFVSYKKFKQKEPTYILDNKGFRYDPKNGEYGFISWDRILKFEEEKIKFDKFLFIHISNPEEIIENEKSRAKRNLMKINLKTHGTPISVSEVGLKIEYNTLKSEFKKFHKEFSKITIQ